MRILYYIDKLCRWIWELFFDQTQYIPCNKERAEMQIRRFD